MGFSGLHRKVKSDSLYLRNCEKAWCSLGSSSNSGSLLCGLKLHLRNLWFERKKLIDLSPQNPT